MTLRFRFAAAALMLVPLALAAFGLAAPALAQVPGGLSVFVNADALDRNAAPADFAARKAEATRALLTQFRYDGPVHFYRPQLKPGGVIVLNPAYDATAWFLDVMRARDKAPPFRPRSKPATVKYLAAGEIDAMCARHAARRTSSEPTPAQLADMRGKCEADLVSALTKLRASPAAADIDAVAIYDSTTFWFWSDLFDTDLLVPAFPAAKSP